MSSHNHNQIHQAAQAAKEAQDRAERQAQELADAAEAQAAQAAAALAEQIANRPPPPRLSFFQKLHQKGGTFFFISIAFHLILIAIATTYVVQTINAKEKLKFTAGLKPPGPPGQKSLEYKVQTAKRSQSMSTPMASTRLTSTASNVKVAIPDAPTNMSSSSAMPSMMGGMAGTGFGAGGGSGGGGGGGGGMGGAMAAMPASGFTVFGFKGAGGGRGLVGHLYDIKQTPDKKPTQADSNDRSFIAKWEKEFNDKKFDLKMLTPYFKSPVELMAVRFWIPSCKARELPAAFGVEKDVKPVSLLAHYQGKVSPPKDGTYRFVGFGDSYIGIKFNGKVILPFDRKGSRIYLEGESAGVFYEKTKGGHAVSDPVRVSSGVPYDIEIILSEGVGGLTGFSLLIEREEDKDRYKKTPKGVPILPIWELDTSSPIPTYTGQPGFPTILPDTDQNRIAWKVIRG